MKRLRTALGAWLAIGLAGCVAHTKPPQPPAPAPPVPQASPVASPAAIEARPALLPQPASVRWSDGPEFKVTSATPIVLMAEGARSLFVAQYLAGLLTTVGPIGPAVIERPASVPDGAIALSIGGPDPALGPEAYELSVRAEGIRLRGASPAGLFRGVQTLRQLLPAFLEHDAARPRPIAVPAVEIADHPRFAWRGSMLDVARHFFSVDDVKRHLDLMALHKLNRLHLHLSDDQGFRIEIRSWPNLTAFGGRTEVGGTVGGYYTQDQYRDLVAYAAERFIDIVPEIDVPGHTNAALSSYAELNCDGVAPPPFTDIQVGFSALCPTSEATWRFIDDVVREISEITPGAWFHVGGDEVKKLGLPVYADFINRVQQVVGKYGKRMIGWDEVVTADLERTSVVQHWRPGAALGDLAGRGLSVILSPANRAYLDMQYTKETWLGLYWAGRIEVRDAYEWDPASVIPALPEPSILGVEAPLWTETLANIREVEAMAWPRLAAVAEVGWTPQSERRFEDFAARLAGQATRYEALGINFYRSPQIPWRR